MAMDKLPHDDRDQDNDTNMRDWNKSYTPPDLRKRIVYLHRKQYSVPAIADRLLVSPNTCYATIQRWQQTGQVYTDKELLQQEGLYRHAVDRIFDEQYAQDIVEELLAKKPTTYLREYRRELKANGIIASDSTICRYWQRQKETMKTASTIAKESTFDDYARFWGEVDALYSSKEQGLWLDEMSTNDDDTVRPRGRSKQGTRCYQVTNLTRGNFRFSLELATDISGPVEYQIFDGSVDTVNWIEFLWTRCADVVSEYPGPRSILFADNHTVHKSAEFDEFIEQTGMVCIWLPRYLPFINLTEWVFDGIRMIQQREDEAKGYYQSLMLLHDAAEAMKHKNWIKAARRIGYNV